MLMHLWLLVKFDIYHAALSRLPRAQEMQHKTAQTAQDGLLRALGHCVCVDSWCVKKLEKKEVTGLDSVVTVLELRTRLEASFHLQWRDRYHTQGFSSDFGRNWRPHQQTYL
jgi:hypothetical protein